MKKLYTVGNCIHIIFINFSHYLKLTVLLDPNRNYHKETTDINY